jgi:hypothetical protein
MWICPISRLTGCQDWIRVDAITEVRYEEIRPDRQEIPSHYAVKVRTGDKVILRTVIECPTEPEARAAVLGVIREIDCRRNLGGL